MSLVGILAGAIVLGLLWRVIHFVIRIVLLLVVIGLVAGYIDSHQQPTRPTSAPGAHRPR